MKPMKAKPRVQGLLIRFFLAVAWMAALGLRPSSLQAHSWVGVYKDQVDSVVVVLGQGVCAGSLVSEDLVLTAWHCVPYLRTVFVVLRNPEVRLRAQVIDRDRRHDLALLRLEKPVEGRKVLRLAGRSSDSQESSLQEGDPVATIGHPLAISTRWLSGVLLDDRAYLISAGIVSKINEKNIISDLSLSPGNSGGPLLNQKGEMVGVASAKLVGLAAGQIGYFTPVEKATPLMENSEKKGPLPWWWADNSQRLFLTLVLDPVLDELGRDLSHWGLEWSLALRDRWRWSLGRTRWGSSENMLYWRTGYLHRFSRQGIGTTSLDVSVGENYYRFSAGQTGHATALALGLQLRTLRFEWARLFHPEVEGSSFTVGFGVGR